MAALPSESSVSPSTDEAFSPRTTEDSQSTKKVVTIGYSETTWSTDQDGTMDNATVPELDTPLDFTMKESTLMLSTPEPVTSEGTTFAITTEDTTIKHTTSDSITRKGPIESTTFDSITTKTPIESTTSDSITTKTPIESTTSDHMTSSVFAQDTTQSDDVTTVSMTTEQPSGGDGGEYIGVIIAGSVVGVLLVLGIIILCIILKQRLDKR